MAVLQAQTNSANGYSLHSVSNVRLQIFASVGYPTNTLAIINSCLGAATGLQVDSLIYSLGLASLSLGQYQDYQSSFARFFGTNAYQDLGFLYIQKSDLGLENLINTTAECLLVALLLQIKNYESNPLISGVYISVFNQYFERNPQALSVSVLLVQLYTAIIYNSDEAPILNNQMLNYSTVVNPSDFS